MIAITHQLKSNFSIQHKQAITTLLVCKVEDLPHKFKMACLVLLTKVWCNIFCFWFSIIKQY